VELISVKAPSAVPPVHVNPAPQISQPPPKP
jgi:hypothetical protein